MRLVHFHIPKSVHVVPLCCTQGIQIHQCSISVCIFQCKQTLTLSKQHCGHWTDIFNLLGIEKFLDFQISYMMLILSHWICLRKYIYICCLIEITLSITNSILKHILPSQFQWHLQQYMDLWAPPVIAMAWPQSTKTVALSIKHSENTISTTAQYKGNNFPHWLRHSTKLSLWVHLPQIRHMDKVCN